MSNAVVYLQGGLGNQLFQASFIYAYGKKNKINFGIYNINNSNPHSNINYHTNVFPFLQVLPSNNNCIVFREPSNKCFSYIDNIPKFSQDCLFVGYFQCEKYFQEYREELISQFQFPNFNSEPKSIFVHIRRGDYLKIPLHNLNLKNYLRHSILYLKNIINLIDLKLYVLSDEIEYCIQNKLFQDIFDPNNIIYQKGCNELETISIMKNCKYGGVCSNSTFSWWGAYLNTNKEKTIIFPKQWFNEESFYTEIAFKGSYIVDINSLEIVNI